QYLSLPKLQISAPRRRVDSFGALCLIIESATLVPVKEDVRVLVAQLNERVIDVVVSELVQKPFDRLNLLAAESLESSVKHQADMILRLPIHILANLQNGGPKRFE